jgi:hypothetical protein
MPTPPRPVPFVPPTHRRSRQQGQRDQLQVDLLLAHELDRLGGVGAQLLLERRDARLEHRLLVLGVVVLGVLGDVAELARFLDALGDLAATVAAQMLDLGLELLEAFRC